MRRHKRNRRHQRSKKARVENTWYRFPEQGKMAGICAGFAEYYDISNLMARGITVTGAVFMPQLVIVAYIVGIFMLPTRHELVDSAPHDNDEVFEDESVLGRVSRKARKRRRKARAMDDVLHSEEAGPDVGVSIDRKRMILRRYKENMSRLDDRLQNLERHVTSKRFDLSQEIDSL